MPLISVAAEAPEFIHPLTPSSVTEGQPAELDVQVKGYPEPEVQWFLDGLPVRKDANHIITKEGDNVRLSICSAEIDDEGIYTVKAANPIGSVSVQAELRVECK